MKINERKSNFELLRIILMLFIVGGHILMWSGKLSNLNNTGDYYLSNLLRSFFTISVNVFVLISGYFGIKLNWKKLLKLESRIIIYTYITLFLAVLYGIHNFSLLEDIKLLFPLLTKQYWFITTYFILCLFSPYLNKFLQMLSKEELKKVILLSIVVFYCVATFCYGINAEQIVPDAGYGIVNFIILYCIGFYLKNYYEDKYSKKIYFLCFLLCIIVLFMTNLFFSILLRFYFDAFISYNSIFVLFGAINFFLVFKNFQLKHNKYINRMSSRCLAVYIIHMSPVLGKYIFQNILNVAALSGIHLFIGVLVIPIIVYILCYIIDVLIDMIMYPIDKYILKVR